MSQFIETVQNLKNGTVTGQTNLSVRFSRTHQDYWKSRIRRRPYIDRHGRRVIPPEYSVRMRLLGHDTWFNLQTSNQVAAAAKARDIYVSLISQGWEATEAIYKPSPLAVAEVCTVGEFLADVAKRSHLKLSTVRRYAVKLRKMVSDLARLETGLKRKERRAKYDHVNGGQKRWRAKVDAQRLDILTPESVNAWRNRYVAKAGDDPVARKSAERSAASYLRCARSLFTKDVTSMLRVKLPPISPFLGVKLKDPGPQRYQSTINPEWLLACAEAELRKAEPQQYLALTLCLWAGLRRKEADTLMWEQVDLADAQIHVRRTRWFEPKTEESQRSIDLAEQAVSILRSFKAGSTSEFVLDGSEPAPGATYDYYRCDCTWRGLHDWLRSKGVQHGKAIHSLRKESGSLIAATFGIEAARQHLGHRDIRTTSAHYVSKKKRVEVRIGDGVPGHLEAVP